jgi:toxin ParE1/3/4
MTIRFSQRAIVDLEEIYDYGVQHFGVAQSDAYHAELYATLTLLEETPLLARLRAEFTKPVRIHPWRNHAIVYVSEPDQIYIVRLLHATNDMMFHLSSLE